MDIRPGLDKDTEVCGFTREAEGKPERLEDMGEARHCGAMWLVLTCGCLSRWWPSQSGT